MPTSYKNKIYTTLGTPTEEASDSIISISDSAGRLLKDYTIEGKSIVWNQMLDKSKYHATITKNGVTFTNNGDGSITVNGTCELSAGYVGFSLYGYPKPEGGDKAGHKYGIFGCPSGGSSSTYRISASIRNSDGGYSSGFSDTGEGSISKNAITEGQYVLCEIAIYAGYTANNLVFKPQLFDLTQMFGAGNEPATPAEFRAMFPDDYYPYNDGELKTIVPTSIEVSGVERFQLLDKSKYHATITKNGVTFTNNGDGTITVNGAASSTAIYSLILPADKFGIAGHKYMSYGCPPGSLNDEYRIANTIAKSVSYAGGFSDRGDGAISRVLEEGETFESYIFIAAGYTANNLVFKPQLFDLTEMFGIGNEPSSVDEFFYRITVSYSITDKSRYESSKPNTTYTINGITFTVQNDGSILCNGTVGTTANYAGFYYSSKVSGVSGNTLYKDHLYFMLGPSPQYANTTTLNNSTPYRIVKALEDSSTARLYFAYSPSGTVVNNQWMYPLAIDLTELYGAGNEPRTVDDFRRRFLFFGYNPDAYKTTLINTIKWFPTGMKSAGSVYDEINFLSQTATTNIGSVDMSTFNWRYSDNYSVWITNDLSGLATFPATSTERANMVTLNYETVPSTGFLTGTALGLCTSLKTIPTRGIFIRNGSSTEKPTGMLYYELANSVTQSITLPKIPMYKGFNSIKSPNDEVQYSPLSLTYYSTDQANAEKGFITSYKRKLYMGRNIEWNQLMDKSWNYPTLVTANGVTFTKNADGSVSAIGTVGTSVNYSSCYFTTALTTVANHIYLCRDCAPQNFNFTNLLSVTGVGSIFKANEATTTGRLFKAFSPSGASVNYIIKPQLYDLTLMFGAGNEPSTIDEFYQYFGNGFYDYNTGEIQPLFKISRKSQWGSLPKHYTARWDGVNAAMVRLNDAKDIPTNITNFAHRGSVNANYSNPFDSIYPWSGIRLCNVDLAAYRNLSHGDSITKCVKAWEGDASFSYTDANGVWRYRPEFWGKSWEDDTYRYFDVADKNVYDSSYVYYPEAIVGRWNGRSVSMTIGDAEKNCLIPSVGMPGKRIAMRTLHTYAKNYGATIDSIYSVDADDLLCIVEFATMNTQNAIGQGVAYIYRQLSDLIQEDATNSATVKVLAAAGSAYCIPGAIFDIGTSDGGVQVGSFTVVSATPNVGDAQYLDVTLDQAVTVTGANYWSVHGLVNVADEAIGSKSGYIGTNGKCNAYYRGIVMYGNMWFYILGAYKNEDDHHIWIANSDAEADNYDALDTTVHYDTGLVLPTAGGYTKKLGLLSRSGLLSIPSFCIETGGDSGNPVGDYFYNGVYTWNAVLLRGGDAHNGSYVGAFYGGWSSAASYGTWSVSARPRLKNP